MSGGAFDYAQDRLEWQIARALADEIRKNKTPDEYDGDWWTGQRWSDETIAEFRKALEALRIAYVYAQRIDWLLSGDDSEDTFHKRLAHDLANYRFIGVDEDV